VFLNELQLRRVEYGDERDPNMRKFLIEISPTSRAHEIDKPMFIAQGLNDPRYAYNSVQSIATSILVTLTNLLLCGWCSLSTND
jgi:dipeptidyl aminopeptidase/acylaminoacyl peptidase